MSGKSFVSPRLRPGEGVVGWHSCQYVLRGSTKLPLLRDHRAGLYKEPQHPYTEALLSAVPIPDPVAGEKRERVILTGDVPSPVNPPPGCRFRQRCSLAYERCLEEEPQFKDDGGNHWVACQKSA